LGFHQRGFAFFADNIHAQLNAFITDEHGWPCNQLANFVLRLTAKRTIKCAFAVACSAANFAHEFYPFRLISKMADKDRCDSYLNLTMKRLVLSSPVVDNRAKNDCRRAA
jgi:hypothetical protein